MTRYSTKTPIADDGSAVQVVIVGGFTPLPTATSAIISTLQTSATGSSFAVFSSAACTAMEIFNNTGTAIEYQRGGAGAAFPILNGTSRLIIGISNANQIGIRRVDQSNVQVTTAAEIFA